MEDDTTVKLPLVEQDNVQDWTYLKEQTMATRWPQGVSGNPNGRPPNKASITYQIKQLLEAGEGVNAKKLAKTAIDKANEGSFPHFKEVIDRTDGKLGEVEVVQDNRQFNIVVSDRASGLLDKVSSRTKQPPAVSDSGNVPIEEESSPGVDCSVSQDS